MKKWIGEFFYFLIIAFVLAACSGNRKAHKCNTCPKWEDSVILEHN